MVYVNKAAWALPSYCSRIQVAVTIGGYFLWLQLRNAVKLGM